ncbi:hypothetical protein [Nostoc sp. MS1]|uniref:hypothetical protein n=1 Tax=Nostoc sp. MS1 TaxID=2764711 RepID=UPI001CC69060|nr:hypothetical protein [Nostoc sp. MS1]
MLSVLLTTPSDSSLIFVGVAYAGTEESSTSISISLLFCVIYSLFVQLSSAIKLYSYINVNGS